VPRSTTAWWGTAGLVDGGRATTEQIEGGGQALGFELAALELGKVIQHVRRPAAAFIGTGGCAMACGPRKGSARDGELEFRTRIRLGSGAGREMTKRDPPVGDSE
jgi:hypothetical protein